MLSYIELKTGHSHRGPAWISRVERSRSGQTVYFNGRALKSLKGTGISSNYYDIETGEQFWISGVKRNGGDRHWAGGGKVLIDSAVVDEYLAFRGATLLDPARFEITRDIRPTDRDHFNRLENRGA
jgi:hypothetical protein